MPISLLIPAGARLVLASASPRRRELLTLMGLTFDVRPADVDETNFDGELPLPYVRRIAASKAAAVGESGEVVIAADTTVDVDEEILVKPHDEADARRMLRLLSGRSHLAHTAIAVRTIGADGSVRSGSAESSSEVRFATLSDDVIDWYVATGEPFGKAGAYALQGAGGSLVESVNGSVSGIIGLPVVELADALAQLSDRVYLV
jgi:septum formation protein